jgi:flagellar biosynthesis/type III secretory pathway M-ring protein FliF/YscJ
LEDELEISDAAVPLRRRDRLTLRDELGDLVRDDPDAAAKVLRSWIGSTN